jgi:hypothetical protein
VVLRELLQANGPACDPAALAERLLALPRPACVIAGLLLVQRNRPLARQLVPALVDAAARDEAGAANLLWRFAGTPDDARSSSAWWKRKRRPRLPSNGCASTLA